ncbi:nucleoside triphosphate pyrophosphohydrolase [Shewanella sp. OPT22]|nr:nucleoside triphosphate pyrophosphohydrolase [Shewanella sp. OPT22]
MTEKIEQLLSVMSQLRNPKSGCPWDIKQTYASIVPFTLEEAYEVADTIERESWDELPDELGDLLFQVVFYCQIAKEEGRFEFDDVVQRIHDKLIRRHPHVFEDAKLQGSEQANWEKLKFAERKQKSQDSVLDDIPIALPALSRAHKIQKRAASIGFDWDNINDVSAKVTEELQEVMEEVEQPSVDKERLKDELGDLFFSVVNLARHLEVEPEEAVRQANHKFETRFRQVELAVKQDNKVMSDLNIEQLDSYWDSVKNSEK